MTNGPDPIRSDHAPPPRLLFWLLIGAAILSTLASTLGMHGLYRVFKPLAMVLAVTVVMAQRPPVRQRHWLLAGLVFSLAGDVFLLFQGYFVPGLVAFLLAHLAYIAFFRKDSPWLPSRGALAATLCAGLAVYAWLWIGGLPPGLRGPVAAYVLVIALMAAQAIGRATVLRNRRATLVAVGACCFMLSDSLLAINRFVTPLPLAQLWVLGSYYAAQLLIVRGAR